MLNIVSSLFSRREPVELVRVRKPTTLDVFHLSEAIISSIDLGYFANRLELFYNFPEVFMGYRKGDRFFYLPSKYKYFSEKEELDCLKEKNIVPIMVNLDIRLMESSPKRGSLSPLSYSHEQDARMEFYHHYPLIDADNNILYFADIPKKMISKAFDVDISRFNEKYGANHIGERRKNSPEGPEGNVVPMNS